ncbi:MAG: hypothetical protein Q8R34_01790 [bacterium]|nr:hypothetical protein [bacterium]
MEKFPSFEKEKSFQEKHNNWLTETKIFLESIGIGVGATLVAEQIFKAVGLELPPGSLPLIGSVSTSFSLYNLNRLRNKKND